MADGYTKTKFAHPTRTATGKARAHVRLSTLDTLWFNTGTLCNIECANCYIESSPKNDRLVYLTLADVVPFLQEAQAMNTREIGITGGEPFMNPDILDILDVCLTHAFKVLVLTNAMRPMMRPHIQNGLQSLQHTYADQLTLRVSLDHYSRALHEKERGPGTFAPAMDGLNWLSKKGFAITAAGRTCWGEDDTTARRGYATLFNENRIRIDAHDPHALLLFPEMDAQAEPPEITTDCWDILGQSPDRMMCASSRMVIRRKGTDRATLTACTLLPYSAEFELGEDLTTARRDVYLNHPYCATFCVLGGGSCSN